jgi:hypothetical protein
MCFYYFYLIIIFFYDRNLYSNRNSNYLVPLLHQFYQIFFPILNICISIVNTMGPNNIEIKSQISKFVLSHSETFLHILTSKASDLKTLEELKLITNLLCKLAPFDSLKFENLATNYSAEYNSVFSRIHKELLNLICVYFVPEQLKQIRKEVEVHQLALANMNGTSSNGLNTKEGIAKATTASLAEIASNICSYSTSIMKVSQFNIQFLIFSPRIESHQLHPCIFFNYVKFYLKTHFL